MIRLRGRKENGGWFPRRGRGRDGLRLLHGEKVHGVWRGRGGRGGGGGADGDVVVVEKVRLLDGRDVRRDVVDVEGVEHGGVCVIEIGQEFLHFHGCGQRELWGRDG